jgi:hypothetical protein
MLIQSSLRRKILFTMVIKVSSVLVDRNRWNPLEIYVLENKTGLNMNHDGDRETNISGRFWRHCVEVAVRLK